jgi:hypothetical protein
MSLIARALTVLLVLSIIPLAFLTPGSVGQGVTTVTSLQTITTAVSTSSTEVVTVQSTSTSTFTSYYTTTSYWNKARELTHQTLSISSTEGGTYCGMYDKRSFSVNANEVISIRLTSNIPIDFFVMSYKDYTAWHAANGCPVTSALVEQYSVDSVSMNLTIPESGSYYLTFLNTSPDTTAKIQLRADDVGVATPSSMTTTTEVVSLSQSTTTQAFLVTETRVLTTVRTEQVPSSIGGIPGFPMESILVGLITAFAILAVLRRRHTSDKASSVRTPSS